MCPQVWGIVPLRGIVPLLCASAAAQTCISYFPDSATFPFPLAITTQMTFTFTNPNGSVSTNSSSIPGTVFFDNPRNQAAAVLGGDQLFQACGNVFPSRAGTATFLNTNVPQKSQMTVTINSGCGSMSITEDAINTVINGQPAHRQVIPVQHCNWRVHNQFSRQSPLSWHRPDYRDSVGTSNT
jgi:hypothetical protein